MNNTTKIYLGLDTTSVEYAYNLSNSLKNIIDGIKIGKEFFSSNGPDGVKKLNETEIPIFLDLKFHDIPNTVYKAIKSLAGLKPKILNIHVLGGEKMLKAARESINENFDGDKPLLIGVTLLTSLNENDIALMGFKYNIVETVLKLSQIAKENELDGVVCSPLEITKVREECGKNFTIITPGIRLDSSQNDDQTRTLSPVEAKERGSDIRIHTEYVLGSLMPHLALVRS